MSRIGTINLTQQYDKDGNNFYDKTDSYFHNFRKSFPDEASTITAGATYREVRPLVKNVDAAIKKNDNEYTYPAKDNVTHKLALEFTKRYLRRYLTVPVKLPGDPMDFNMQSSAGLLGKKTGYPKTPEYLKSPIFDKYKADCESIPIQLVNHKDEFLSVADDLSRDKVRLVDSVGKEFLFKQKLLYDNQNQSFSDNWKIGFIKYGMVKQYGGFSRFVRLFELCELLSMSDVSGYDKCAILKDVYELRNELLILPGDPALAAEYKKMLDYVTHYTLNPVRCFYDGSIVMQDHSNSSGQNNTTIDNSILHVIIVFNLIIQIYFDINKELPTYSQFLTHFELGVYSDDKTLGLKNLPITTEEYAIKEIKVYAEYGMVIKKSASKCFSHMPGTLFTDENPIEFLGSNSHWSEIDDMYLPKPRLGKLCTTLCKKLVLQKKDISPLDQFSKLVMILALLVDVDPLLKAAVETFIIFIMDEHPLQIVEFQNLLDTFDLKDISNTFAFDYLISGYESASYKHSSFRDPKSFIFSFLGLDGWLALKLINIPEMNKVSRSEKLLERIAARTGMTEDGKNWLIAATDPFHDKKLLVSGYPDRELSPSVCQNVKQTMTITRPTTLASSETWGCHIFVDDILVPTICSAADSNYNVITTTESDPTFPVGGLTVTAFNVVGEANSNFIASTLSTANKLVGQLALNPSYLVGRTRLVAAGFEVHNVTPELTRGGTVTVYEQATAEQEEACFDQIDIVIVSDPDDIFDDSDGTSSKPYKKKNKKVTAPGPSTYGNRTMRLGTVPPKNTAEALLLPGSQQWEAKYGCLCVQTMHDMENPAQYCAPTSTFYSNHEDLSLVPQCASNGFAERAYSSYPILAISDGEAVLNRGIYKNNKISPFSRKGAFFTGLSNTTVLTANYNAIVESIVSQQKPELIVLAKPSPSEDYIAAQLYSLIVREMPVGVRVSENGLGDWFLGIVDEVSNVVSSIGKPIMMMNDAYREGRQQSTTVKQLPTLNNSNSPWAANGNTNQMKSKPLPQIPQKKKALPAIPLKKTKALPQVPRKNNSR